jgi:DNA invertase Pin-like site-specific DNA recombinase
MLWVGAGAAGAAKEEPMSFDIYCRVSEVGGRGGESFASPEEQEAAARAWAAQAGEEVDEVVEELDVSGSLAADARELGRLIRRVEAGESEGVIVRYVDRFGRDMVENALAHDRIVAGGGRLIATASGYDSAHLNADTRMIFHIQSAIAQAQRERNRESRMAGKERAVARGVYAAPAPFGYDRDDDGRLQPNRDADSVREIFRLRAEGVGFSDIARGIDGVLTRSGVRRVVMNRAYVGEQRIPNPAKKGEPRVIPKSHQPLVTETEWEAANAVKGRAPTHNGLAAKTQLKGIVRCGICGGTMHVCAYGKARDKMTYACTSGCGGTSISVAKVEPPVLHQLDVAVAQRAPQVAAVIEGDNRYADALASVEDAKAALAEYRDNIELQQVLGVSDFIAGLRTRKKAVETARRALRDLPRPEPFRSRKMSLEEFDMEDRRRFYQRVIAEVLVFPRSEPQRLRMRWHGAENSVVVQPFKPVKLAQADPIAELQKAAAKGDRDAKRYLTAKRIALGDAEGVIA